MFDPYINKLNVCRRTVTTVSLSLLLQFCYILRPTILSIIRANGSSTGCSCTLRFAFSFKPSSLFHHSVQSNVNNSNTFGTMVICSRNFEQLRFNRSACPRGKGDNLGMSFRSSKNDILSVLNRIASVRRF